MTEYRVTFGQKYRRAGHPTFRAAHPDGYVTIIADDRDAARAIIAKRLGSEWAFDYAEPFDDKWPMYHPLGELARWSS